jgi:hypothetical protein
MANLPVGENGAIFSLSFRSCLAHLAGGEPGEIVWSIPEAIAAPGDVQVGPQKDEVQAVEIAGDRIRDVEHLERRPERFESLLLGRGILARPAEAQEREACTDAVLEGNVALEPDVRQARARPGRGPIFAEVIRRPARLFADDR